jgi:3,4-dihydroxybenzoyl-citryl-spermidine/N-citryl-spermidine--spermidine ligase
LPDLSAADRRVRKQLLDALIFERLVPLSEGRREAFGEEQSFAFRLGARTYRCRGRVGGFGRVRIAANSVTRDGGAPSQSIDWREIVEQLPAGVAERDALLEELAGTVRFCRWNEEHLPAHSRREQSYAELESSLHEGHPYHPCFKARTGFSLEDHRRYGPEAGKSFELSWLAVRRAELRSNLPADACEFWTRELGAGAVRELCSALAAKGASTTEYGLMPCHPWQLSRLRDAARDVFAAGTLIPLDVFTGTYRATQSLRTLLPVHPARGGHVKLPLATRVSSALRTLAPETVKAAPVVSRWLANLVRSDPFFERIAGVTILSEYASIAYEPVEGAKTSLCEQLGVICRENVASGLGESEAAVPFNALFACEVDGRPFIEPWITRYGVSRWLGCLLDVTILPLWRLLAGHGIALEAHAQNLILIHRAGLPVRLAVRDFHDSVEYVERYLAEPSQLPDFGALDRRFANAPLDRYYAMSSVEELRELFTDSLFVFNLCELAALLCEHYAVPEPRFWALVRAVLHDCPSDDATARRGALLNLDAPRVRVESLLERRLHGSSESRFHHLVPNPLHRARKELHVRPRPHTGHQ